LTKLVQYKERTVLGATRCLSALEKNHLAHVEML
jgi:hypothetical protein